MATSLARRTYVTGLISHLDLDLAKTVLFYYVLATYALKAKRHIAARGVVASVKEIYAWAAKVGACEIQIGID